MIDDVALEDDGDAGSVLGMTFADALGRMGLLIIDMGDAGKSCRRACPHLVKRTHPEVSARWTEGIAFAGMPASRHAATKSSRAIARGVIPVRAWADTERVVALLAVPQWPFVLKAIRSVFVPGSCPMVQGNVQAGQ